MSDIKPTLDAIDETLGYVEWDGYSRDAMVWSAEEPESPEEAAKAQLAAFAGRFHAYCRQVVAAFREFAAEVKPLLDELVAAFPNTIDLAERIERARVERRCYLHSSYRRRVLSRGRRSR